MIHILKLAAVLLWLSLLPIFLLISPFILIASIFDPVPFSAKREIAASRMVMKRRISELERRS